MATKNYFAHASPDGQTSATIIMDKDTDFQGLLGENLAAQHYLTSQGVDVDVFAHRFVESVARRVPATRTIWHSQATIAAASARR